MPYAKFLAANVAGGVCWVGATTAAVYYLGHRTDRLARRRTAS